MSTSSGPKANVMPIIFGEYLDGGKPFPDNLSDFPTNPNISEFHFMLGFASEVYNDGRGTGRFNPTWNANYFRAENNNIMKHRNDNGNVTVVVLISIGGVGTEHPFNPANRDEWVFNAIASLKEIINPFGGLIDGIDINYEVIKSSDIDFAYCIGKVISGLKEEGLIQVASIAPSYQVQPHYRRLYEGYGDIINWVNFQFYNHTVPSTDEFIRLYGDLSNDYDGAKLLAGFSTDPNFKGVTLEVFLEGCSYLLSTNSLPGIFVWNANDSAVSTKPFWVEYIAQILLVNPPN